jgi:hypothetical protein
VWVEDCIAHAKRFFACDRDDVGKTAKEIEEDMASRLFMDSVTEVFKRSWSLLHHGRSEFTVEDILGITGCTAEDTWKYTQSFTYTVATASHDHLNRLLSTYVSFYFMSYFPILVPKEGSPGVFVKNPVFDLNPTDYDEVFVRDSLWWGTRL